MTHMRLTVGHDAPTALCDRDITSGLVTDPADVTCPDCSSRAGRIIAEQERAAAEIADEAEWE
jgi:hypothetical protein